MRIEYKNNIYNVTNELTISQMLKNGGIKIEEKTENILIDNIDSEKPVRKVGRRLRK